YAFCISQRESILRSMSEGIPSLAGSFHAQDNSGSTQQYREIQPQRPVLDVFAVKIHAIDLRRVGAPRNLPQAGYSRTELERFRFIATGHDRQGRRRT